MPARVASSVASVVLKLRRRGRRQLGRVARRAGVRRIWLTGPVNTGAVTFSRQWVEGWIAVVPGSPPVRVTLRLNDFDVVSSWANGPTETSSQDGEVRRFRFAMNDIWKYLSTSDRLCVVAGRSVLLIRGGGRYYSPTGRYYSPTDSGAGSVDELRAKLADGYVFSRTGWLQLSKKLNVTWQHGVLTQAQRVRDFVRDAFGYDVFFGYGTMLGAVRDNGFIGHDSDLDMAYVSKHSAGSEVADELRDIAFALINAGFRVVAFPTHLRVAGTVGDKEDVYVDLFHTFFDDEDLLRFPYGVAGTAQVHRAEWAGVREIDFAGATGLIPIAAERVLELLYGPGWRQPQPGFSWERDRRDRAVGALLPPDVVEQVYWADFYKNTACTARSTFFDALDALADVPRTVVDIGCGDGRDCFAHADAGRRVFGLDWSHIAIDQARARIAEPASVARDTARSASVACDTARSASVAREITFELCDVAQPAALSSVLDEVRGAAGDEPVLFYLRFVLHSIRPDVQDGLLAVITAKSRPGDMFAAEFRTEQDKDRTKVHRNHYRHFQNGPEFGRRLRERYGFGLIEEEQGTGLSPYRDEDPHLYRVIARRR